MVPIKENRNDPTKVIKYEDQSKSFRTTEETYIDKNYSGRNGDGCNFAKTRVRTTRKPVIGDKFCIKESSFILTDQGWVRFKDINTNRHNVATLENGTNLKYVKPSAKYEFDCVNEPLYMMESQQVKMVCTMDHKVYVRRRDHTDYELIEAKHILGKRVCYKKNAVNQNIEKYQTEIESLVLNKTDNDWKIITSSISEAENIQIKCLHAGWSATLHEQTNGSIVVYINRDDNTPEVNHSHVHTQHKQN